MKPLNLVSCLFVLLGWFVATTAWAADHVQVTENARRHFRAGVAYIEDPTGPKYEEAYREFHLAYAESPTYRILTNIGLCALNLERDGEAIAAYEGFLAKATAADIPKAKRVIMERDIETLKASLVTVRLRTSPAEITLDDERLTNKGTSVVNRYEGKGGALTLGLHPGHHRITATVPGLEPQTWDFEANSASTHEHEFALKPPAEKAASEANARSKAIRVTAAPEAPRARKTPTLVYVGGALTLAFVASTAVTWALAASKHRDYERLDLTPKTAAEVKELRTEGKRLDAFTVVGASAAGLAAVGTAVLYFMASPKRDEAKSAQVHVLPSLGADLAGVAVTGQF